MPGTIGLVNYGIFEDHANKSRTRRNQSAEMNVTVIITTYNHPRWLEKVVYGFSVQTHQAFELVIADDGSGPETREVISRLRSETGLSIQHVWHEDRGFRKCRILNKAISKASHDYLVFVDGDGVPHRDFLETHVRLATPGHFLSGGIVRLPMDLSQSITREDIESGRAFDARWLRERGVKRKLRLLTKHRFLGAFFDAITTTRPTFNGHNASVFKEDVMRVNGFDERMQYGGLDRELGERLVNAGIHGIQVRHRAGCIHLDHARGYENEETWRRNREIRQRTRQSRGLRTEYGIEQRRVA